METETLKEWFPNGKLSQQSISQEGLVSVPLSSGDWLVLATESLTAREQFLLQTLSVKKEVKSENPWYRYLVQGTGEVPAAVEKIQFLHVRLWHQERTEQDIKAWLEMMTAILPHQVTHFQYSEQNWVFVLDASYDLDVREVLSDTLPAMEFDFGLRLTMFLGQIWPPLQVQTWPQLFAAEKNLFLEWTKVQQQSTLLTFSKLVLWGQTTACQLEGVTQSLREMIDTQEGLAEIIFALWEEGAVATKAAQRLYIHRNTLQYRLEKWQSWTGLQLRDMTDLSLCYLTIIERSF